MTEHISTNQQINTDLQQWATEYAESSQGRMRVLPYDPTKYPAQNNISTNGEPQNVAFIDGIAQLAQPRYNEVSQALMNQEESTGYISMIGELLQGGNNVELITNHGDLIDIAVAHAALYTNLRKLGYPKDQESDPGHNPIRTGIIISKMISFLEYKIESNYVSCTDVLGLLEHTTYLSYPKTESTKKHLRDRIIPNEIDRHNRKMRDHVIKDLGRGGLLLAIAASGTTDKPLPHDPHTIRMSKIGNGTIDLFKKQRTYVAPMAVWYKGDDPIMRLVDIPRMITSDAEAHQAMEHIAANLTASLEDTTFVYSD